MKYIVSMAIDGRLDIEVEADTPLDARCEAIRAFATADLSGMTIIGKDAVNCSDENGNIVMDY